MSDFKYQSYDSAKMDQIIGDRDLTEDLYLEYKKATENPDLADFLNHHRGEVEKAEYAGILDRRIGDLRNAINRAALALQNGDTASIASAFFSMGEKAEKLNHPPEDEMSELYRAQLEKMKSELPIKLRNSKIEFLKGCVEIIARRIWEKDTKQEIKLIDACHEVWPELVDVAEHYNVGWDLYPNEAAGLKPWLRPLAPEYAKRPGAPKKPKK